MNLIEDTPTLADLELENRIDAARREFARTGTNFNWQRLRRLIALRSPGQVRRMERAKGLV